MIERRKNRSDAPHEAAALYLDAAASACGAQAVALSREGGDLLAGAGRDHNLTALAILGAGLGAALRASLDTYRVRDPDRGPREAARGALPDAPDAGSLAAGDLDAMAERVTQGEDLYTSRLTIRGTTLYLASVGARVPRQRVVEDSLGRILAPILGS